MGLNENFIESRRVFVKCQPHNQYKINNFSLYVIFLNHMIIMLNSFLWKHTQTFFFEKETYTSLI